MENNRTETNNENVESIQEVMDRVIKLETTSQQCAYIATILDLYDGSSTYRLDPIFFPTPHTDAHTKLRLHAGLPIIYHEPLSLPRMRTQQPETAGTQRGP